MAISAAEVDKARTFIGAVTAVYIEVCDGIGQGFTKLEPARKFIDSVAALMGRAKDVEDRLHPALPRPEDRKQIEAPRRQLPPPDALSATSRADEAALPAPFEQQCCATRLVGKRFLEFRKRSSPGHRLSRHGHHPAAHPRQDTIFRSPWDNGISPCASASGSPRAF
jgi:hypothetical protein